MNSTSEQAMQLSLGQACRVLLWRDLLLAFRRRAEMINPLIFYVLVVTLFAIGAGSDVKALQAIGPGVLWVAALLSSLLSLEAIFRSDFEDGSLELLALSAHPLWVLVLMKVLAHWLISGLPLILVAPLLAEALHIPMRVWPLLLLTLLLGTPVLSLLGAIAVALTVGLRRGGIILALLVLPLYVPVLIFAVGAIATALAGIPAVAQISILAGLLVFSLSISPLATAAALRVSLS